MNACMENPIGALVWRDKINIVSASTGFSSSIYFMELGLGGKYSIVVYTIRQCVYTGLIVLVSSVSGARMVSILNHESRELDAVS